MIEYVNLEELTDEQLRDWGNQRTVVLRQSGNGMTVPVFEGRASGWHVENHELHLRVRFALFDDEGVETTAVIDFRTFAEGTWCDVRCLEYPFDSEAMTAARKAREQQEAEQAEQARTSAAAHALGLANGGVAQGPPRAVRRRG